MAMLISNGRRPVYLFWTQTAAWSCNQAWHIYGPVSAASNNRKGEVPQLEKKSGLFVIIYQNVGIDVILLLINYEDVVWKVSNVKDNIFYCYLFRLFWHLKNVLVFFFLDRKSFDKSLSLSPISLALSSGRSVDLCYLILVAVWAQTDSMELWVCRDFSALWSELHQKQRLRNRATICF